MNLKEQAKVWAKKQHWENVKNFPDTANNDGIVTWWVEKAWLAGYKAGLRKR